MSVFRNYDSRAAGGVFKNAFPNNYPQSWTPTQRNVRSNPNIPSQPQRVQPHERGTFYPTSASGGGTLAPSMSSAGCGCGGGCGGSADANVELPPSPAEMATGHSFPGIRLSGGAATGTHLHTGVPRKPVPVPRVQSRTTGALRPVPARGTVRMSGTAVRLTAGGAMGGRRSGL
jgi:hypothetical protein